ncbi:tetratricopeptide repeat protein [Actinacidiphila paucisporea]|uniref:tetratricopeptide repeat protein n=1 Tax=Actinacidiphila paucisporea TaxID=310782 RepID=UPI000937C488|nr:tetratricopeptide repeat protein [Actinacidiphila paucisporea]
MRENRLGVVLVHGIRSGPKAWDPLRKLIAADKGLGFASTLAFSYATGLKRVHPLRVFPGIDTAADSLREYLATEAGAYEHLVLVSHSQGGLVVQRCLARMLGDGRGRELARVRRVVMLACPNNGSELYLSLRRTVLGSGHPQESQLRPLNEQVTHTLRTVLRDAVNATGVTDRTCPIPFSVYAGESDGVVRPASAQSVFPDAAALPGDHATILKATTADHRTFTTLRRLLLAAEGVDRSLSVEPTEALAGLPPRSRTFTGREEDVRALLALLAPGGGGQRPVLVQAVAGMGGVGKTELALQSAERALLEPGWFPGGALFADLNGYDPDPGRRVGAADALDGFLRTLGTSADDIPPGVPARSALLRSALTARTSRGERTLLVIDNASSEEQVLPLLPLLPGDGTTPALITSRNTLALGARVHSLDVLDAEAAADLIRQELHQALGPSDTRAADDPDATMDLGRLCGGLPLALRITAALLVDTPRRPIASLTAALRAGHSRLDHLSRADRAVRGAFDLSYHHLTPAQQRLFRLLPLNSGPDISTTAAHHLTGDGDEATTEHLLSDLAAAHLIEPAPVWGRWRFHDLLRLHADEHGRRHAADDDREAALGRLLDHYLSTAQAADTYMETRAGEPVSDLFTGREQALAWLDAERTNLTAAATAGPADHEAHTALSFALARYLNFRRHFDDWSVLAAQAADAFHRTGDRHHEGTALNNLGLALRLLDRYDEAIIALQQDLEICRETDNRYGEGQALKNLGLILQELRRFDEAVTAFTVAADIFRQTDDPRKADETLAILEEVRQQQHDGQA